MFHPTATTRSKPKRRWLTFSLRTLLIGATLLSIVLAYFGNILLRVRRQQAIRREIESPFLIHYARARVEIFADASAVSPLAPSLPPKSLAKPDPVRPKWVHFRQSHFLSPTCMSMEKQNKMSQLSRRSHASLILVAQLSIRAARDSAELKRSSLGPPNRAASVSA